MLPASTEMLLINYDQVLEGPGCAILNSLWSIRNLLSPYSGGPAFLFIFIFIIYFQIIALSFCILYAGFYIDFIEFIH